MINQFTALRRWRLATLGAVAALAIGTVLHVASTRTHTDATAPAPDLRTVSQLRTITQTVPGNITVAKAGAAYVTSTERWAYFDLPHGIRVLNPGISRLRCGDRSLAPASGASAHAGANQNEPTLYSLSDLQQLAGARVDLLVEVPVLNDNSNCPEWTIAPTTHHVQDPAGHTLVFLYQVVNRLSLDEHP